MTVECFDTCIHYSTLKTFFIKLFFKPRQNKAVENRNKEETGLLKMVPQYCLLRIAPNIIQITSVVNLS